MNSFRRIIVAAAIIIFAGGGPLRAAPEKKGLARQAADDFLKLFGDHPGFRLVHAKGIVCEGVFEPTREAAELSTAAHFGGGPVPVIVRFSDGTGVPQIPDGDPHGDPKGLAIRFKLPGDQSTDIVANGQNGFVAGTPRDFVDFITAVASTAPDSPKPTPIETFLASHPASAAFLGRPNPTPTSFATQAYFANNAFVFVNAAGKKQPIRYQILPVAGESHLTNEEAAKKPADFLFDDIKSRIGNGAIDFRLVAQIPQADDPTSDATKVWPDDRKTIELGVIHIKRVDPKSDETQKQLAFDPTNLTDGIELSDDPLPAFRSKVYAISAARRQ